MNRYACVVGLALLAGACSMASANVDQERTALMTRDREWSQAAKNVDNFMSFLAPEASIYPPGSPIVTGQTSIRNMFAEMSKAPGFSIQWTVAKTEVASSGDVGYTTGTYSSTMAGVTEKGKYVTLWKKIDGQWKAVEDIFNPDAPPVAPHTMVAPSALKWVDPPPGLPAGAKVAVVAGDPTQAAPFTIRAQMPAGYRVPPHWHPTTENLTVLSGTVALGMGDTWDQAAMKELPTGGAVVMPADMRHSFLAKTATTIQIHGTGPFGINYVNPADDPRQASK